MHRKFYEGLEVGRVISEIGTHADTLLLDRWCTNHELQWIEVEDPSA